MVLQRLQLIEALTMGLQVVPIQAPLRQVFHERRLIVQVSGRELAQLIELEIQHLGAEIFEFEEIVSDLGCRVTAEPFSNAA